MHDHCLFISIARKLIASMRRYVVHEVVWGLRYALPFLVSEFIEKITISRQCPLPLCQGFEDLMKKYEIVIPTKAVSSGS